VLTEMSLHFGGDSTKLILAVRQAQAMSQQKRPELALELKRAKAEYRKVEKAQAALVQNLKMIVLRSGSEMQKKVQGELNVLDAKRIETEARIQNLEEELREVDIPPDFAERVMATIYNLTGLRGMALLHWPRDKQRQLMRMLFGSGSLKGRTRDGELRSQSGIFLQRLPKGAPIARFVWTGPNAWTRTTWANPRSTLIWEARAWFGVFPGTLSDVEAVMEHYNGNDNKVNFDLPQLQQVAAIATDPAIRVPKYRPYTRPREPTRWSA
jgi:hypothetical protein